MKTKDWILAAAILSVLMVALFNWSLQVDKRDLGRQIDVLNARAAALQEQVKEREAIIRQKEHHIIIAEDSINVLQELAKELKGEYKQLEGVLEELAGKVGDIPPDSSYAFLQEEAYPFRGDLKYPFNERQVQGIHLTYLQKRQQDIMLVSLKRQLDVCEEEKQLHHGVSTELRGIIDLMEQNKADVEQRHAIEIERRDKEIRREVRRKRLWQAGAVVAAAAAIIF